MKTLKKLYATYRSLINEPLTEEELAFYQTVSL